MARPSVVQELAAVVAAGDASERGAESIALHRGGNRLRPALGRADESGERAVLALAAVARRGRAAYQIEKQAPVESRQRREEALDEGSGKGVVGVLRIVRRPPEFVEVAHRVPGRLLGRKAPCELRGLVRHVETVQPVEKGKAV